MNDLHGAQLRGAADRSGRKGGTQDIHRRISRINGPDDAADHMRDVGEALYCHELRHTYGAGDADASKVVACEIDEHCVLGTLLCIRQQICCQPRIFFVVLSSFARTCDRVGIDGAAGDLDEHLW